MMYAGNVEMFADKTLYNPAVIFWGEGGGYLTQRRTNEKKIGIQNYP